MEGKRLYSFLAVCCLLALACGALQAAQTVKGTVVSADRDRVSIVADGSGNSIIVKPAPTASVMRGQTGKELRKAKLYELATGDRVVAVVDQKGRGTSLKAYYAIAKGTVSSVNGEKIFFRDGRSVRLNKGTQVVFPDGKMGKASDIKPGAMLLCRANPVTSRVYTVVATKAKPTAPKVAVKPVAPAPVPVIKPEVTSVTFVAPDPLNAKDWMRVDLTGTPGGRAVCEIKHLIPRTVMKEIEPGHYRASVMVPGNKTAKDEPLLGHLTVSSVDAEVVQASRLFSFDPTAAPPIVLAAAPEPPAPTPEVAPAPVAPPEPVPAPVVEAPKVKAPVVIGSPISGARIQRTIVASGTADPGSSVMVTVNYSNGLGGILNLSGQVSSQLIVASDKGEFSVGPIPLEGPLATKGLIFTVKASYPDSASAVLVSVFGDRI